MQSSAAIEAARHGWRPLVPEIKRLFAAQWADPELPAMEFRSSARLADWLEAKGFTVSRRACGIPTAFIASKGSGKGPVIAILAEYDALPGLGNSSEAGFAPTGSAAGHACGHNHIGPANSGAAIAAAEAIAALNLPGEIRVIGCPAEELLWGKIALLKRGAFDGIDAILTSHGDYQTGSLSRPCQSVVSGEFVFQGEAGHGGKASRSNALLMAERAVALLEDIEKKHEGVFFRHVLRNAGLMPSITPAETRLWLSARGHPYESVRAAYDEAAKGFAELGTSRLRHQFIAESRGYLPNHVLGRHLDEALRLVGPPAWSNHDIAFMQELVNAVSPGTSLTLDRGIRFFDEGVDQYGQDDGEVSWRIPLGRVNWAYPEEVPIHHWAWTALSGNTASEAGPLMASEALAIAVVTIFANPGIIDTAKAELRERTKQTNLAGPRLGAVETLTKSPARFWEAGWTETAPGESP
jgi:aminobenzoyl-glutamate utilization protein B